MAKLHATLACMSEGKSQDLLRKKFSKDKNNIPNIALKPRKDTRDGTVECFIKSKSGGKSTAHWIDEGENIQVKIHQMILKGFKPRYIYVDEINFLSPNQIEQLRNIVDMFDIDVHCYGLMTDFTSHMFDSSKRLLEIANRDCIKFLHDSCDSDGNIPNVNARINNGNIIYNGNQIEVGDSQYIPQTYKNWKNGVIK